MTEKGFAVLFPGERVKEERMRKTTGQERERVSHVYAERKERERKCVRRSERKIFSVFCFSLSLSLSLVSLHQQLNCACR